MAGSQLLYSEILELVHKAKTKKEKVRILKHYNSDGLRMIIKSSFDPKIKWMYFTDVNFLKVSFSPIG